MVVPRPLLAVLIAAVACCAVVARADADAGGPVTPSPAATPTAVVRALADAFAGKSLPALRGLLTLDFRFHTADASLPRLVDVDRDHELRVAATMFHGEIANGGALLLGAERITFDIGPLSESPDPEHPDSTAHYRSVVAAGFRGHIYLPDGTVYHSGTRGVEVFYVVRGDAAQLAGAQWPDSTRWYLRRWFDDPDALVATLDTLRGDCDPAAAATAAAGLALGIHPPGDPACPALDIACDLPRAGPARVEVFDLAGRQVNQRRFDVAAPGTTRLQAGAGARLVPGVYWVRLTQGDQSRTRMVVVAR